MARRKVPKLRYKVTYSYQHPVYDPNGAPLKGSEVGNLGKVGLIVKEVRERGGYAQVFDRETGAPVVIEEDLLWRSGLVLSTVVIRKDGDPNLRGEVVLAEGGERDCWTVDMPERVAVRWPDGERTVEIVNDLRVVRDAE